jgi:tetratricopeptide (TPR) repeat protein
LAVNLLKEEKNSEALALLHRSLKLAENNDHGLAMTYNNLACYYRKQGHLRSALIQLEKAMEIEQRFDQTAAKADTHLNLCAVLTQLIRHELALQNAQ